LTGGTEAVDEPASRRSRLQDLIRDARAVPRLLGDDPAKAASLIAALGGAFFLVWELRPHHPAIEKALRPSGGDGGDFHSFSGDVRFDFGHLDFNHFEADVFDSFDAGWTKALSNMTTYSN